MASLPQGMEPHERPSAPYLAAVPLPAPRQAPIGFVPCRVRLDKGLLRDAEAARARLIESQHAAEQARADYQHAIRRLHAAGGSLREIAEALRLSHQRVHQIIDETAEPTRPWWRRRGRRWRGTAGGRPFFGAGGP